MKQCLILLFCCAVFFVLSSCRSINKNKNILYDESRYLGLSVFSPKNTQNADVLIFVHGGNWKSGKKSTYNFFAKRMATKGIVCIVIDYRLAQDTDYYGMTMDVARSVQWVRNNISKYGGNPGRIFISGHSAGGHLSALVAMDNSFFNSLGMKNPLKGIVLIDAFGLDMYNYLLKYKDEYNGIYYPTFSTDQSIWKKASPFFYISKSTPPVLILSGGKTYPAIKEYTRSFYEAIKKYQPQARLIVNPRKSHYGMILQFYNSDNTNFNEVISFIKNTP